MTTVFGIKNCDTVKKTIKWLQEQGLSPQLHDYRTDGLDAAWLADMAKTFGWETLINKKSTTWRGLSEDLKSDLDASRTLDLLQQHPTLIKRPIVLHGNIALIGFNEAEYQRAFIHHVS